MIAFSKEARMIRRDRVQDRGQLDARSIALEIGQIIGKGGEPSLPQSLLKSCDHQGAFAIAQRDPALSINQGRYFLQIDGGQRAGSPAHQVHRVWKVLHRARWPHAARMSSPSAPSILSRFNRIFTCPLTFASASTQPSSLEPPKSGGAATSSVEMVNTSDTESTITPIMTTLFRTVTSTTMMQVRSEYALAGSPNFMRISTMGTTFPRRLITPLTYSGNCGTLVMSMTLMISRTLSTDTAYSSLSSAKVRYLPVLLMSSSLPTWGGPHAARVDRFRRNVI